MKHWKVLLIALALCFVNIAGPNESAQAAALLKPGSTGGDVWDLQFRLKVMGYYTQPLDGQFGMNTATAVSQFQKAYGLKADGYAGNDTWAMLRKYSVNRSELDILAKIIYSEARGEPYEGQVAVGAVVLNRVQSGQFPDTVQGVVFQPRAFTAVDDGQYWLTPDRQAYLAAEDAVKGWDPTNNSLYYFNPDTATSAWIWSRPQTVKIGRHIFAK
ncbi:spore cortex-lytic enzyme [Paenibacillus rigui]|uniref:Spore cortex-lytic enzyme n=1 Tax=Paenibacillus rigui TaxID=554312 RepID=A0A229UHU8_9BACL|nr:spore cortex-lytic enzyme [Paenibacillus rigui]OXM82966.1 spore cortex-lytic enzyme [Paenibacillus rigui]